MESENPERTLDNLTNLETARMTLRWALERIRGLEGTITETQGLLKAATSARESALRELESYRESMDERTKVLAEKERFVSEMQTILNDLFKGEVDVAGFVRRKTRLEADHKALEAKLKRRIADAEAAHAREVEEHGKRLSEMEATYTSALADAQKRYHEQIEKLQREHSDGLAAEKEKYAQFKENTIAELRVQADEYHQKTVILEVEYSRKRKELQNDFERLKAKLLDENERRQETHQRTLTQLQEGWTAEREKLEARLKQREEQVLAMEDKLRGMERDFIQQHDQLSAQNESHIQELRGQYQEALAAQKADAAKESQRQAKELAAARDELANREADFQKERMALLEQQNQLREHISMEYEGTLRAFQQSAVEKDAQRTKEHTARLEEVRKHYEDLLHSEWDERRKLAQAHSSELSALLDQMKAHRQSIDAERSQMLEERSAERRKQVEDFEKSLKGIERSFFERSQEQLERQAAALRTLDEQFRERESQRREESEADLEALRKYFDGTLAQQKSDFAKQADAHARDMQIQRSQARDQLDDAQAALRDEQKQRQSAVTELRKSLDSEHADRETGLKRRLAGELEEARTKLREAESRFEADRAEFARQLELLQEQGLMKHQQTLSDHEKALAAARREHETMMAQREKAHQEELRARAAEFAQRITDIRARLKDRQAGMEKERAELVRRLDLLREDQAEKHRQALLAQEAVIAKHDEARAKQVEELRARMREERVALAAEREKLAAEQTAFQEQEIRKREKILRDLETFFVQRQTERAKDTSDAIETLRRHYHQAMASLREEMGQAPAKPPAERPPAEPKPAKPAGRTALLEVEGPPRKRRWALWAAACSAAAAAAAAVVLFWPSSPANYPVPFSHPTALVWRDGTLWASDWKEQAIYRMRADRKGLSVARRFVVPESHIMGMALAGEDIFVADSWKREIQRWRAGSDGLTLQAAWPSPGVSPSALHFDGKRLWSADRLSKRVYEHAIDQDLTVLRSFDIGHSAVGLHSDPRRFWTADDQNRLIHRRRWDDSLSLVESLKLPELDDGKAALSAFTMLGDRVWIGRDGQARLISRPLSEFRSEK